MVKNTFIVLYAFIFTLFAQQLPNDSLNDKMFQTPLNTVHFQI